MTVSQEIAASPAQTIPARIVVGVTGHRELSNQTILADKVRSVFDKIEQQMTSLPCTSVLFTILSPLAEGADRLVAFEGLKRPGAQLHAVLPLEKEEYMRDFKGSESRAEFEELLQGSRVKQLNASGNRNESYQQAGRYVVDHCDVLIALWDGEAAAGLGGTGEIVSYADSKQCPLYWIQSKPPYEIKREPDKGLECRTLNDLDRYNTEQVEAGKFAGEMTDHWAKFNEQATASSYPSDKLRAIYEKVLPHYVRADLLSQKYKNRYYWGGVLIYCLAVAAVAIAALYVFKPVSNPLISLLEVAFMIVILIILRRGQRSHWHKKYMDYRFWAERCRSMFFMSLLGVEMDATAVCRSSSTAESVGWVRAAFYSVWCDLPRSTPLVSSEIEGLRKFLATAWIDGQIEYHKGASEKNKKRHHRLTGIGEALFQLTLIAALLHVVDKVHLIKEHAPEIVRHALEFLGTYESWLVFTAIVAPAMGGALGAIRTHREYLRTAKRSDNAAQRLETLKGPILKSESAESLLRLIREAEEIMLHENEDWRTVVRYHELELPG